MPTTTDGADAPDLAGRAMTRSSSSPSPPPAACHLQITTAATTAANASVNPSSPVAQSSSSSRVAGAAAGSGQNQACAACKYQRRKCNPDCPLAPYFPADQQRRFLNAHRLFGVGHIQATLRETPPDLHTDAMRALIFQAEARAYDPVGGCCRIILDYERQLGVAETELAAVLRHLDHCRHQAAAAAIAQDAYVDDPGMLLLSPGSNPADVHDGVDALYAGHEINNGEANHHDHDHYFVGAADQIHPQKHQPYNYFYYDGPAAGDESSSHAWGNAGNVHQQYGNGVKAESPVALGDQIETQFVDGFDVKPEIAGAAGAVLMEHDAGSGASFDDHHLEQKVVATVVKNELLDHQAAAHMAAESSSRCQLGLGFSSF